MRKSLKFISSAMAILMLVSSLLVGNTIVFSAATTTKSATVTISKAGDSKKLNTSDLFSSFSLGTSEISNKRLVSFDEKTMKVTAKAAGKTHVTLYNNKTKSKATKIINYTIVVNTVTSAKSSDTWHNETIKGTTVWAIKDIPLYKEKSLKTKVGTYKYLVKSDQVMREATVVEADGNLLKIKVKNSKDDIVTGWTNASKTLYVNMSELNTNIQYQITNAYKSIFVVGDGSNYFKNEVKTYDPSTSTEGINKCESKKYNPSNANTAYEKSYVKLNNITAQKLYSYDNDGKRDGKVYSDKLKKNIFVAPVLWDFAKQIGYAECVAERNGYNLKIYDSYRPQNVCNKFWDATVTADKTKAGNSLFTRTVGGSTWNKAWFVARTTDGRTSDHARGIAIDVTMVYKDTDKEIYTQSNIHDLSCNSVKNVGEDWYNTLSNVLHKIMTTANDKKPAMVPLASEWWHFNIANSAAYPATYYNVRF